MKLDFEKHEMVMLILLVLVSLILFSYKLGVDSFWLDELKTLHRTKITWKLHYNIWPPIYFWLVWIWAKVCGTSEIALRSFSLFWAILAIIATFYLGNLFSPKVGLFASVFVIFNTTTYKYAQEARGYTMLLALSAISTAMFIRVLQEKNKQREWVVSALINIIGVLTHYAFLLLLIGGYAASYAWAFLYNRKQQVKYLLQSLSACIIIVTVYWMFNLSHQMSEFHQTNQKDLLEAILNLIASKHTLWQKWVFIGMLIWSIYLVWRDKYWRKWGGILWSIAVLFLVLYAGTCLLVSPVVRVRYLIPVLPILCVIASYPLSKLSFKEGFMIALMWTIPFGAYFTRYSTSFPHKESWRQAASWVKTHYKGGLVAVYHYNLYKDYNLDCSKHNMKCIELNRFKEMIEENSIGLRKEDRVWIILPRGYKEWDYRTEKIMIDRGFKLVQKKKIGKKSIILCFEKRL